MNTVNPFSPLKSGEPLSTVEIRRVGAPVDVNALPATEAWIYDKTPNDAQFRQSSNPNQTVEQTLQSIESLLKQNLPQENSFDILHVLGTEDNQILYQSLKIPFDFNTIQLNVIGGIVAVTYGAVQDVSGGVGLPVVDPNQFYNWTFGSNIVNYDIAATSEFVSMTFTGPQEIRFATRKAGQLSFWVHPYSALDLRNSSTGGNSLLSTLEMSGTVMFLQ